MSKVHLMDRSRNFRGLGQSDHDWAHQTACGYVRDEVSMFPRDVTCKLCKKEMEKRK